MSREMWQGIGPEQRVEQVPIKSVTNQNTITLHALSDPNALTAPSAQYLVAHSPASVSIENRQGWPAAVLTQLPAGAASAISGPRLL